MCGAVRLAAGWGWWTTAVAREEQRKRKTGGREEELGRLREKEGEREEVTDQEQKKDRAHERTHARTQTGSPPSQRRTRSILIHVFSSCLFSSLSQFRVPPASVGACVGVAGRLRCLLCPLPLSFSGNVNVLLTHSSQLLSQPQSSALV